MGKETKILKSAENVAFALFTLNGKKPNKNSGTMPPKVFHSQAYFMAIAQHQNVHHRSVNYKYCILYHTEA